MDNIQVFWDEKYTPLSRRLCFLILKKYEIQNFLKVYNYTSHYDIGVNSRFWGQGIKKIHYPAQKLWPWRVILKIKVKRAMPHMLCPVLACIWYTVFHPDGLGGNSPPPNNFKFLSKTQQTTMLCSGCKWRYQSSAPPKFEIPPPKVKGSGWNTVWYSWVWFRFIQNRGQRIKISNFHTLTSTLETIQGRYTAANPHTG